LSIDIKRSLENYDKKELLKIAKNMNINIPKGWSETTIVELLSLNVTYKDLQIVDEKKIKAKTSKKADSAIIIKDLVVKFEDITAIDKLNLKIKQGELFSLLGPNGAGKTTTINILNGILKPTKGTAIVGNYDVRTSLKEIKS
jgi:ABC-type sugar transport system ATPase subunit